MNTAYFVRRPRTVDELRAVHLLSEELEYEIVAETVLPGMDYENFVTDMLADRQFIEDAAELCSEGKPMRCLLVRTLCREGGILVVPERLAFVKWAARVP